MKIDKSERRGRNRNHNPAESAKQYKLAMAVVAGYSDLMPIRVAREIVESTSGDMKRQYARSNPNTKFYAWIGDPKAKGLPVDPIGPFSNEEEAEQYIRAHNKGVGGSISEGKRKNKIVRLVNSESNGLAEATELTEGFHGRKPQYIEDIIEIEKYRTKLAHLGDLVEFEILDKGGRHVIPISFHDENEDYDSQDHVSVASTADRQQLILGGGDQSIDLESFDLTDIEKLKDYVLVGEIFSISYFTDKHHLEGPAYQKKGTEYIHKFGEEEGGELPTLIYDKLNYRMLIIGGSYEVRDEGIYN